VLVDAFSSAPTLLGKLIYDGTIVAYWAITLRAFTPITRSEWVFNHDSVAVGTGESRCLVEFRLSDKASSASSDCFLLGESRGFPMIYNDLAVSIALAKDVHFGSVLLVCY
jgi:hypothetical protein